MCLSKKIATVSAMESDRLSSLPDDILHSILHGLPLKDVVRTSGVSRRFEKMWVSALATSLVLDFTDRDFVSDQTPAQAAATVERCLKRHAETGAPLHVLRVALDAGLGGVTAFGQGVAGWVASAVARGAREVEVNLMPVKRAGAAAQLEVEAGNDEVLFVELPRDLFAARNALVRLALDRTSLRSVPGHVAGLAGLRSLSLSHTDFTDDDAHVVLPSCHSLESLSLRRCHLLTSVRIIGNKLQSLEIVNCLAVRKLRVTAPALESFAFHGDIVYVSDDEDDDLVPAADLGATPLLRDAYLSHIGFGGIFNEEYDYAYYNFIRCVAHARTLTICSNGLLMLAQFGREYDPDLAIDVSNLQELQLLVALASYINLATLSSFFQHNLPPLLDRLFVRILDESKDDNRALFTGEVNDALFTGEENDALFTGEVDQGNIYIDDDDDFVLGQLRLIKVVNLWGTFLELEMIALLVYRAPVLEELVLITAAPGDDELRDFILGHVSALWKASPEVRITVCRPNEDSSENAAHSRFHHEE